MVDKQNDEPDQLFCTVNYIKSQKKEDQQSKPSEILEQNNGPLPPDDFVFDEQVQIEYRNSKKNNN